MAPSFSLSRALMRRRQTAHRQRGFTLIELLVSVLIAGGIVSGLLYLVNELLQADRSESTRDETQRELQLALDFMANEIQQAVYVYTDATSLPVVNPGDPARSMLEYLPAAELPNEVAPVLAFWKQQRFPESVIELCATDPTNGTLTGTTCEAGHSYSLVVYSLARPDDNEVWDGPARIIRSAMTEFDLDDATGTPNRNPNYISPVDPDDGRADFNGWPLTGTTPEFNQPADTLVDFVDDGSGAESAGFARGSGVSACPTNNLVVGPQDVRNYLVSPSNPLTFGADPVRSFYACIDEPPASPAAWNQEVIIYLQGNASGRSGAVSQNGFLPALETTVLSRGILGKNPQSFQ
ncbi:MAG: PulJ/GspJ family protein [Elainellaceae cyanobacterium]